MIGLRDWIYLNWIMRISFDEIEVDCVVLTRTHTHTLVYIYRGFSYLFYIEVET